MELTREQKLFLEQKLQILSRSKFRSRFHLKQADLSYIEKHGLSTIEEHALDFLNHRLFPAFIPNDGKQTPMKGHPVFIAQHATATCCRGCLFKWYHIPKNRELTEKEKRFVLALVLYWIEKEKNMVVK